MCLYHSFFGLAIPFDNQIGSTSISAWPVSSSWSRSASLSVCCAAAAVNDRLTATTTISGLEPPGLPVWWRNIYNPFIRSIFPRKRNGRGITWGIYFQLNVCILSLFHVRVFAVTSTLSGGGSTEASDWCLWRLWCYWFWPWFTSWSASLAKIYRAKS